MSPQPCTCQHLDHQRKDCLYPAGCTGCLCERHTTTLVAHDFGGFEHCPTPDPDGLIEAIGEALLFVSSGIDPHRTDHTDRLTYRIQFDNRLLRESTAHGMAYQYGFVASLDHQVGP